jgi:hypothetical protein
MDAWPKTTYLVPRLGRAGIHAHVGLQARLHEDIGDDAGTLCGLGAGVLEGS